MQHSRKQRHRQHSYTWIWLIVAAVILVGGWYLYSQTLGHNPIEKIRYPEGATNHIPDLEKAVCLDPSLQHKDYEGFSVAFDSDNRIPRWVGWELLATEINGDQRRSNRFWQDETMPGCPTTADYRNSGFDRGHMYPAGDAKWSEQSMQQCFAMTNICPQAHSLNNGAWKTLEEKCRLWAKRDSALIIVAGPILSPQECSYIGDNRVRVPSAFFKVILAPYLERPRAIGFVYPNDYSPGNMRDYSMSVDEVEELTGLDFFSNLPDDIETIVEAKTSFKEWNQ